MQAPQVEPRQVTKRTTRSPGRAPVVTAATAPPTRASRPAPTRLPVLALGMARKPGRRRRRIWAWIVSPIDERAHGRDERLPVKALYDDVDHWVNMLRALAGK